jgi:hypothetical protein
MHVDPKILPIFVTKGQRDKHPSKYNNLVKNVKVHQPSKLTHKKTMSQQLHHHKINQLQQIVYQINQNKTKLTHLIMIFF